MTKAEEIGDPDSTLNRSAAEEPLFILCARDLTAPARVLDWANEAEKAGVKQRKVDEARGLAYLMQRWTGQKKMPD